MATHSLGARTIQIAWPQSTQTIHTIRYSPQGVRALLQGLDHRKHSQTPVEMRLEFENVGKCPHCGRALKVMTNSKDGSKFYGCTGYPSCRYTRSISGGISRPSGKKTMKCPKCGAPLKELTNKKDGSVFFGCTRYPKCRYTRNK